MNYQIVSDGACDLGMEFAKKNNVKIVPFYVNFKEIVDCKECVDIDIREFYQRIVDDPHHFPSSSMPSVQDYIDVFEPIIKNNEAVICICITAKFSGSYNCAVNAKDILLETYPDAQIEVIDSTLNTISEGNFVREAIRMKENGLSFIEVVDNLNRIKETGRIIFTVGNLSYLIHGGRIGKVMGLAANKIGIKPMILMKDGEIFSNGIARSRKKSIQKLYSQIREFFESNNYNANDYEIAVGYGYDYEEAVSFRDELLEDMKTYSNKDHIDIYQIGATICVHTGPYPLGVGIIKKFDA